VRLHRLKRLFVGSPLPTAQQRHERLGRATALAVFASDALSSVAYATEEILLVLILAGTVALSYSLPIAIAIAILIAIVVSSYRQTIRAYPQGGGAYIVSKDNLGTTAGLVAGAALLIDYVLTVAVSVAAGVAALTSAVPFLFRYRVPLCVLAVAAVSVANLRGLRESGKLFAAPTYLFVGSLGALIVYGAAGREVVQALPRMVLQPEKRVHLVVEETADPGGADAGGLGLEVQHLPEHSALPIERSIAPRLAHRYFVMGEHPQRIAGVGGDVLVTADEPRSVLQIVGDEQIKRQLGRADLVPQPVGPKRCFQRRERRRIPHKHVEPRIECVHAMNQDCSVHLGGPGPGTPRRRAGARQRRIEHGKKRIGADTRGAIKCDCAAPLPEDLRCREITYRLPCRLVDRARPIRGLVIQARLAGEPVRLLDIGPLDVIGAQSIGLAMPARRGGRQFCRRRPARGNPQQAFRRLCFG